ncbi:sulfite oxidase [Bacillus sp. V5-8f]|uniref:sulfite oxidase n=1 Tax=Bacillus sp. V5-8f TaxID=2053044 RepID=UPI000C788A25|nr:sulfite oxidase [Bacillus sp. V5-8f]PLT33422.1 sulfite oxidase [Bacillus sp. V5-8f]
MEHNRFLKARPYLTTRKLSPENQESPVHFINATTYPHDYFYRRNHFPYPELISTSLTIAGLVEKPTSISLEQIRSLPSNRLKVVLECAGDKRNLFEPKVYGEQWEKGAISQGYWRGVPLGVLLEYTGLITGAKEVVFEAHDYGKRKGLDQIIPFARSLPLEKALHTDTLVAYEYNDKPIPFKHGFPFRLIVPQWYAMASVKWVKSITVIDKQFTGPFQAIDYVYYPKKEEDTGKFPVTSLNVNSTIQQPLNMEILNTGKHLIRGIALTGQGRIRKVEISFNRGKTWTPAIVESGEQYAWVRWKYLWEVQEKGEYTISSRATDTSGRTQPVTSYWNRKGYGYNAVDMIKMKVE